jgi:heme exporter protein D
MQPANDPGTSGHMLALGIVMIALFLGLRQWYEWKARGPELSEKDRSFFRHQDARRLAGLILLGMLAVEIWAGSRIPYRNANRPNPAFVLIWLMVGIELIILLLLAMVDLLQTKNYARRQRRSMILERLRMLRDARHQGGVGQSPPAADPGHDGH